MCIKCPHCNGDLPTQEDVDFITKEMTELTQRLIDWHEVTNRGNVMTVEQVKDVIRKLSALSDKRKHYMKIVGAITK